MKYWKHMTIDQFTFSIYSKSKQKNNCRSTL